MLSSTTAILSKAAWTTAALATFVNINVNKPCRDLIISNNTIDFSGPRPRTNDAAIMVTNTWDCLITGNKINGPVRTPNTPPSGAPLLVIDILTATGNGTTSTVTTDRPHGLSTGHIVSIFNCYNGPNAGPVTVTVTSAYQFTFSGSYNSTSTPMVVPGQVMVYDPTLVPQNTSNYLLMGQVHGIAIGDGNGNVGHAESRHPRQPDLGDPRPWDLGRP